MAPWQDDIGSHIADDARIMPIIARQSRIGGVTIGDQRRAWLRTLARTKASIDLAELSAITARCSSTPNGYRNIFRAPSSGLGAC